MAHNDDDEEKTDIFHCNPDLYDAVRTVISSKKEELVKQFTEGLLDILLDSVISA